MSRRGRKPPRWRGSKSTAPACGTASSRSSPRWGRSARWATRRTRCRCTTRSGSRRRGRRGAGCPRRSWWSGCARPRTKARWRPSGAPRRLGSEGHPFATIVASGPRSALPHARSSRRAVAAGEWLLLDFGAQVDGYCADITRTVVVGARATERQRVLYGLVYEAQQRARGGVRAGMTGRDADALARDPITARGFGEAFGHSLGHGLGLEVHEAPRLSKTNPSPLPAGAVVTIEPGVYLPGDGGVRIEDDVHLAAAGPELLSDGLTDLL